MDVDIFFASHVGTGIPLGEVVSGTDGFLAGKTLAGAAIDLFENEEVIEEAKKELDDRLKECSIIDENFNDSRIISSCQWQLFLLDCLDFIQKVLGTNKGNFLF